MKMKMWLWICVWMTSICVNEVTSSKGYQVLKKLNEDESVLSVVRSDGVRFLLVDQTIIGAQFEHESYKDQAAFPGFAIMQASLYLNRNIHRAAQIGLGVGTVPTFLRQHGIPTDVVEISDGVVTLAEEFFEYERCEKSGNNACPNGKTYIEDGLVFLKQKVPLKPRYELFIVDVYTGWNPILFFTVENVQQIKQKWLKSGGVLVMNFVGYYNGHHLKIVEAIFNTIKSLFQHVKCFR